MKKLIVRRNLVTMTTAVTVLALFTIAANHNHHVQHLLKVPPSIPNAASRTALPVDYVMAVCSVPKTSVVLVQVVTTDPEPNQHTNERPEKEEDIPMVRGARVTVIKTLYGTPIANQVDIVNPPMPPSHAFANKLDRTITRRMRPGEYWLLAYDNSTAKFEINGYSGAARLLGPDDPAIGRAQRYLDWVGTKDPNKTFAEVERVALDSRRSQIDRDEAYFAMWNLPDERLRRRDPKAPLYLAAQHVTVELLKRRQTPEQRKMGMLNYLDIDPTQPLSKGSDDEFKLRYLLNMLFDEDPVKAGRAGERLYFMSIKSGSENGKPVVYYYPDIIAALEARDAQDRRQGRAGVGAGVLSNLQLVHRRDLTEIQREHTVVIRRLP